LDKAPPLKRASAKKNPDKKTGLQRWGNVEWEKNVRKETLQIVGVSRGKIKRLSIENPGGQHLLNLGGTSKGGGGTKVSPNQRSCEGGDRERDSRGKSASRVRGRCKKKRVKNDTAGEKKISRPKKKKPHF